MTTQTSYSEKGRFISLFRHGLRSNMPFTIISAIIMILAMPVVYFSYGMNDLLWQLSNHSPDIINTVNGTTYIQRMTASGAFLQIGISGVVQFFMMLLALVVALSSAGYLHSKPKTDFFHCLPIRRPHLLGSNILSGCISVLTPFYTIYLIMMAVQLVQFGSYGDFGAVYFLSCLFDIVSITTAVVMVYLFCTLMAVGIGTSFDAFAVTVALGFMPLIIYFTCLAFFESYVYGAASGVGEWSMMLSPFTYTFYRMGLYDYSQFADTWQFIAFYLGGFAICAVLCVLCIYFYNRRKSEIAELSHGGGVLKTVTKCIGAYLGGALFCLMFASSYSTVSVASQIFYTMLGAVMFGVVAELIMSRGARMILKNSVWILGTGAVTCLIFLGIRFDLMGYADYVPRADQVRSVSINYQDRFQSTGRGPRFDDNLTDPGIIATVVNSHRLAVENKPKPVIRERTGMSGSVSIENEYRPYYHIRITYTLNSGRKVTRAYNDYAPAAALELLNLETNAQFIATRSPLFNPAYNWNNATIHLWDSLQIDSTALMIDYVKRDQLLEALRADILGETLAEIKDPSAPAHGMLQIRNRLSGDATDILITHEYTRTMALLGAWGYSDFLSSVHSKYDTMYLMLYTSGWADESRIQTFNASWLRGNINNNLGYNGEIRTDTQILDGDFARHTQAIRITDTSLYSTLHGQAQERLLMNQYRGGEYSPVYHLVYAQGEQIVGGRFMHPGRLPPQLREIADAVNAFEAQAMPEDDREWELYANEVTGTKLIW